MRRKQTLLPGEIIEQRICMIRGQKVLLDKDLAALYGVETFNLNKAVRRNIDRFPGDFVFQLTREEFKNLIFHFGISRWGGTRRPPLAFTEQGVAMLSSVLHSKRAICVNIEIMRAFVRLRGILATHKDLAKKLDELEKKYDQQFQKVFKAIRELMTPPDPPLKGRIGFVVEEPGVRYRVARSKPRTVHSFVRGLRRNQGGDDIGRIVVQD